MTQPLWDSPCAVAFRAGILLAGLAAAVLGPWSCSRPQGRPNDELPAHAAQAKGPDPVAVEPFSFGPAVVVLATGNSDGLMEVCNCSGPMSGGLARRSGMAISYRAAFPTVLLLDAGNSFHHDAGDARNRFLLRAYRQVGYDAVLAGNHEWSVGPGRLARLVKADPVELLSTNVLPARPVWQPALREAMVFSAGPGELAVLSAVGPDAMLFLPDRVKGAIRRRDLDAMTSRIAAEKRRGRAVLVLVHGSQDFADRIATATAADVVIRGSGRGPGESLRRVAGKPVARVGGHQTAGALALRIDREGAVQAAEFRLVVIDETWPLDRRLLQTYQAYAHAAMRQALAAEPVDGLAYEGSATCGRCHVAQYANWRQSRHSQGWNTLVRAGRTEDPNCLACHTTGFGTQRGFYTRDTTPHLAGVNCQDCHRFDLADHAQADFVEPEPTARTCRTCHTPVTDPEFDWQRRQTKIRCPRGAPMRPHQAVDRTDR